MLKNKVLNYSLGIETYTFYFILLTGRITLNKIAIFRDYLKKRENRFNELLTSLLLLNLTDAYKMSRFYVKFPIVLKD